MSAHSNYRQKWVDAGYQSNMGSAIACLPPSDPNYIRVYHLNSAKHAISNLKNKHLKLSRFSDLNDPFELLGISLHEINMRTAIKKFRSRYGGKNGLLCFTEDWAEPLMWSHYASRHRGICLGFDVCRNELQKIQYEADRILAGLGDGIEPRSLDANLQQRLLTTKANGWKYEREQRMVIPVSDTKPRHNLHFVPFRPKLELREVILGPLCKKSLSSVQNLVNARYTDVITFKSRIAFKSFKVVPDERTIP